MSLNLASILLFVMLLGGPILAIQFFVRGFRSFRLVARGRIAQGKVTRLERSRVKGGRHIFYPTVEFVASNGERQTHTPAVGLGRANYRVGTVVQIRYLPDQPSVCAIDGFVYLWLEPIILGAIGIPLLVYGFSVLTACGNRGLLACLGQ